MTKTVDVAAGQKVASTWGNELRDRSCQVFASAAERDAQWPTAPVGAICAIGGRLLMKGTGGWYEPGAGGLIQTTVVPGNARQPTGGNVVGVLPAYTRPAGRKVRVEFWTPQVTANGAGTHALYIDVDGAQVSTMYLPITAATATLPGAMVILHASTGTTFRAFTYTSAPTMDLAGVGIAMVDEGPGGA
jgi:hypothetical protein